MAAMQPARRLYADPAGLFLHQAILDSCQRFAAKTALVDTSTNPVRHISYGEYGELVERVARGLIAAGLQPGEVIGIFLWNCWEFPVAYHAATLAGAIPTLLNPSYRDGDIFLCFLPLYHIYGLNVILNSVLASGGCLVLMPRFDPQRVGEVISQQQITYLMLVPPAMNALSHAAEEGCFPKKHSVRAAKCGAAPLGRPVAERFTNLTGIRVAEGYGMTEASPVTHLGFLEPELYAPDSVGHPAAQTECRMVDEAGNDADPERGGELVMRGPQFMLGYWKSPQTTNEVLRDRWDWSGDVARRDERGHD